MRVAIITQVRGADTLNHTDNLCFFDNENNSVTNTLITVI